MKSEFTILEKTALRRIIAIFSAALITFNMLGSLTVFVIFKFGPSDSRIYRSSSKNSVDISIFKIDRELFGRSSVEYTFFDENEFKYQGKMFDVIKKLMVGDTLFIYCIRDKEEENIVSTIITENENRENIPQKSIALRVSLKNMLLEGLTTSSNYQICIPTSNRFPAYIAFLPNHFFPEILTPPPRS